MDKRCPCGGVILADTEDWDISLCHECYSKSSKGRNAIMVDIEKPYDAFDHHAILFLEEEIERAVGVLEWHKERGEKYGLTPLNHKPLAQARRRISALEVALKYLRQRFL